MNCEKDYDLENILFGKPEIPKASSLVGLLTISRRADLTSEEVNKLLINSGVAQAMPYKMSINRVMAINLSAASFVLGKSISEINQEGVLMPALMVYYSLAEIFDDELDSNLKNGVKADEIDDNRLFEKSGAKKYFDTALLMIIENAKLSNDAKVFLVEKLTSAKDQYLRIEKCLGQLESYSKLPEKEKTTLALYAKNSSFGEVAYVLTLLMAGNDSGSQKIMVAANKMRMFAIFGGLLDDLIDGDKECLNIGNSTTEKRLLVELLVRILNRSL